MRDLSQVADTRPVNPTLRSEDTVTNYVKAVRKFCAFVQVEDPEVLLGRLLGGELDPGARVDACIGVRAALFLGNRIKKIEKWEVLF